MAVASGLGKRWRFRTGRKFPISCLPARRRFPRPRYRIGAMAGWCRCRNRSSAQRFARGAVPLPQQAPWPRLSPLQVANAAITLPVPAKDIFEIQERSSAATQQAVVPSAHHAERTQAPAGNNADAIAKLISIHASASRRMIPGSQSHCRTGPEARAADGALRRAGRPAGWRLPRKMSCSMMSGALGGTRTPTMLLTATSRQRVYQFRHERKDRSIDRHRACARPDRRRRCNKSGMEGQGPAAALRATWRRGSGAAFA